MGLIAGAIVLIVLASVGTCLAACYTPGGCLSKDRHKFHNDSDVITINYASTPDVPDTVPMVLQVDAEM